MTLIPLKKKSKRNKDVSLASMVCSNKKKNKAKKLKLKKQRNRERSFSKWHNKIKDDENTICLGKFNWSGSPIINIYFNTDIEHFLLEMIDKDGNRTILSNTYSVAFVKALRYALRKAERKGLIKNGVAIAPLEEDNDECD